MIPRSVLAHVAAHIEEIDGHWMWTGAVQNHSRPGKRSGYPVATIQGRRVYVHRWSLELKLGRPIAPGFEAHHTCHIRRCINPDHLEELPKAINAREVIRAVAV